MVKHKTFKIPAANIQGKLSLWTRSVPETAVYILVYIKKKNCLLAAHLETLIEKNQWLSLIKLETIFPKKIALLDKLDLFPPSPYCFSCIGCCHIYNSLSFFIQLNTAYSWEIALIAGMFQVYSRRPPSLYP